MVITLRAEDIILKDGVFIKNNTSNNLNEAIDDKIYHQDNTQLEIKEAEADHGSTIDTVANYVSEDGLTYNEVYQILLKLLNYDYALLQKVLSIAQHMVKHGVTIAKESQLTKKKAKKLNIYLDNKYKTPQQISTSVSRGR